MSVTCSVILKLTNSVPTTLVSVNLPSGAMQTTSDTSVCFYLHPMPPTPVCAQHKAELVSVNHVESCHSSAYIWLRSQSAHTAVGRCDGASCYLSGWPPSLLWPWGPLLCFEHARLQGFFLFCTKCSPRNRLSPLSFRCYLPSPHLTYCCALPCSISCVSHLNRKLYSCFHISIAFIHF